jgi:hypothetical protein
MWQPNVFAGSPKLSQWFPTFATEKLAMMGHGVALPIPVPLISVCDTVKQTENE